MRIYLRSLALFLATSAAALVAIQFLTAHTSEEKEDEKFVEEFRNNYQVYALNLPAGISFAGEDVPLGLVDVRERLDRELLVNTYWQSQTILYIKRSHRWFPLIEKILKAEGVPDDFKYLALIESGLTQSVSPAGATGFWQLMKDAAVERGLEVNNEVDERYHIEKSTRVACAYLKEAREKFGSWTLAAASYNMGITGLQKQLERQKATNYYDLILNDETSRYLFRILSAKLILSDPTSYGFIFRHTDLYQPLHYNEVRVSQPIADIATFAFEHGINYKALKYLNPWLRESYLPNTSGKTYTIYLPAQALSEQLVHDKEQVATFTRKKTEETEHGPEGMDDERGED